MIERVLAASSTHVDPPPGLRVQFLNFQTGVPDVINLALALATVILLLLLLYGGVSYMATFGNEDANAKAKQILVGAVIGFVLVVGSWAIMGYVFRLVDYPFSG